MISRAAIFLKEGVKGVTGRAGKRLAKSPTCFSSPNMSHQKAIQARLIRILLHILLYRNGTLMFPYFTIGRGSYQSPMTGQCYIFLIISIYQCS